MAIGPNSSIAVWAVTPNGAKLARRLQDSRPNATLFCSRRLANQVRDIDARMFDRLTDTVEETFNHFDGHIFVMATGIVVRSIAPCLGHKTSDPAVVVVDDSGRFAISLTSGHLGGANQLAQEVAACLDATPVITTATDINDKPAIDVLAAEYGLKIENPQCIKAVNMALLMGEPIQLFDEGGWLKNQLPNSIPFYSTPINGPVVSENDPKAGVWIGDTTCDIGSDILVLRPMSLAVGIGCNRNTPQEEIRDLLFQVLDKFGLAPGSLSSIASIDIKSDEAGICALASELDLPLHFFSKEELARIEDIPTPSATVAKHIGVHSVCEAAAILSSRNGRLIVAKQNNKNVTVAIARKSSTLSV